ncbi:MAG: pyridoxal-phosphate dependent enzyme, partial [Myxococcota bacterium]|nr:pyridoxal-phosphate dependent enzyme [Myxococcota bacterium]
MDAPAPSLLQTLREMIGQADLRVRPYIRETPLRRGRSLEGESGGPVWLKCENLQATGSFKLRGATNKLLSLSPAEKERGIVTASSGNHGLAVAHAGLRLGISGTVFLPETTPQNKARALEASGIQIKYFADDCALTEAHAREYSRTHGLAYVSPYNDLAVIAGQGTLA